jgi:hypothetical protein
MARNAAELLNQSERRNEPHDNRRNDAKLNPLGNLRIAAMDRRESQKIGQLHGSLWNARRAGN